MLSGVSLRGAGGYSQSAKEAQREMLERLSQAPEEDTASERARQLRLESKRRRKKLEREKQAREKEEAERKAKTLAERRSKIQKHTSGFKKAIAEQREKHAAADRKKKERELAMWAKTLAHEQALANYEREQLEQVKATEERLLQSVVDHQPVQQDNSGTNVAYHEDMLSKALDSIRGKPSVSLPQSSPQWKKVEGTVRCDSEQDLGQLPEDNMPFVSRERTIITRSRRDSVGSVSSIDSLEEPSNNRSENTNEPSSVNVADSISEFNDLEAQLGMELGFENANIKDKCKINSQEKDLVYSTKVVPSRMGTSDSRSQSRDLTERPTMQSTSLTPQPSASFSKARHGSPRSTLIECNPILHIADEGLVLDIDALSVCSSPDPDQLTVTPSRTDNSMHGNHGRKHIPHPPSHIPSHIPRKPSMRTPKGNRSMVTPNRERSLSESIPDHTKGIKNIKPDRLNVRRSKYRSEQMNMKANEKHNGKLQQGMHYDIKSGKTPTDDEINVLWDALRKGLHAHRSDPQDNSARPTSRWHERSTRVDSSNFADTTDDKTDEALVYQSSSRNGNGSAATSAGGSRGNLSTGHSSRKRAESALAVAMEITNCQQEAALLSEIDLLNTKIASPTPQVASSTPSTARSDSKPGSSQKNTTSSAKKITVRKSKRILPPRTKTQNEALRKSVNDAAAAIAAMMAANR